MEIQCGISFFIQTFGNHIQNKRADTGKISVNSWSSNYKTITLNARIGYSHSFVEAHKVDAFVAYEQSKYDYNTLSAYRTNYLSTAIPEIFAGSSVPEDKDNGGYSDATARCNFFGRINYGYRQIFCRGNIALRWLHEFCSRSSPNPVRKPGTIPNDDREQNSSNR